MYPPVANFLFFHSLFLAHFFRSGTRSANSGVFASGCASRVESCGKYRRTTQFATQKWDSGGKQSSSAGFATRSELEQSETAWWMLIVVANLGLLLYLPPKSGILVANKVVVLDLPPDQSWNRRKLLGGC